MNNIVLILIFEIVPIILWGLAWYFENSFSTYPDTKKGIKIKAAKANKEVWIYGNKVAGKIFGATATLLFFINALGFIILNASPVVMAFINFLIPCITYMVIEGLIKKKLKSQK